MVRKLLTTLITFVLILLAALTVGRANAPDEAVMTVQVTSADHEAQEGYFSLGDSATVIARPGSDLYKFLSRQRGRKIKVVLTESGTIDRSRLDR